MALMKWTQCRLCGREAGCVNCTRCNIWICGACAKVDRFDEPAKCPKCGKPLTPDEDFWSDSIFERELRQYSKTPPWRMAILGIICTIGALVLGMPSKFLIFLVILTAFLIINALVKREL